MQRMKWLRLLSSMFLMSNWRTLFLNILYVVYFDMLLISLDLGPDYMEDFQPGLSFSLVNRAEISARTSYVLLRKQRFRLHDKKFSPG